MIKKIIKDSRPATLIVSLISTTLGITVAYKKGYMFSDLSWDILRIILVTAAGIFLQSGVNLINNYFEDEASDELKRERNKKFLGLLRSKDEIADFKAGIYLFIISALIGFYLSFHSGIQLLIIELIGIFSAYGYSGKPINYKNYGLGAVMSFIMMGPLMVYGSYFVFSKSFSYIPVLYSFSIGLFIPAILIANELRDYEEDKGRGIGTLTVRLGYKNGRTIYYLLIILTYINTIILVLSKNAKPILLISLLTIPLAFNLKNYEKKKINRLVPATARVYLIYGAFFILLMIINK